MSALYFALPPVLLGGAIVAQLVRRRRRPMSRDWCTVCLVDLPVGGVYEVRHAVEDAAEAEAAGLGGGTAFVATYCRRHAPKGARRS